jgi:hypothetical protein
MNLTRNGSQTLCQRTYRVVHGLGAHRFAVPGQRAGARGRCHRDVRTQCAHGLARAFVRANVDRHLGCGRVQRDGGPIEEIRPGDVVWFEPGEKHWHGASPTTAVTHVAIQEQLDGKTVDWMEHGKSRRAFCSFERPRQRRTVSGPMTTGLTSS